MDGTSDGGGRVRGGGDPVRVHGVDFSAAASDAGRKTWIASGRVDPGDGELLVTDLRPLAELAGLDGAGREDALPALAEWVRALDEEAVVGLDFPFGLPRFVVEETDCGSWRSFISDFPESIGLDGAGGDDGLDGAARSGGGDGAANGGGADRRNDPVRAFAERCVGLTERHGEGTYDKRETDAVVGARSPYGFIADTIAFYGMRDVLAPLVGHVRFAPMDRAEEGWRPAAPPGPTVVETYPAAVLDRLDLRRTNYKGGGDAETARRRRNAEELAERAGIGDESADELTDAMVANAGGDALDAVAACVGAFAAWRGGYEADTAAFDDSDAVPLEGFIYA